MTVTRLAWRGVLLALVGVCPAPALAWNAAGHRLVAAIAWTHLDATTRSRVAQLLREHPDHGRWLAKAKSGGEARSAFIEASTWADDIRRDERFHDAGSDPATPEVAGFPDMQRHRDWHYVNRPLTAIGTAPLSGRLDEQLVALATTVGSTATRRSDRAYALAWLIHLVGDAHQPLHASTRTDAQGRPESDQEWRVINPFNPRRRSATLHAFWDDLPGPPWLRGERLTVASERLTAAYLATPPAPSHSPQWLAESWQIAATSAYPEGDERPPTISAAFYDNARQIAEQRVALAGYRLAELLTEVLRRQRPGA